MRKIDIGKDIAFSRKDNRVWVAQVQIGDQEYIQLISKLCPLELEDLEVVNKSEFITERENDYKKN